MFSSSSSWMLCGRWEAAAATRTLEADLPSDTLLRWFWVADKRSALVRRIVNVRGSF